MSFKLILFIKKGVLLIELNIEFRARKQKIQEEILKPRKCRENRKYKNTTNHDPNVNNPKAINDQESVNFQLIWLLPIYKKNPKIVAVISRKDFAAKFKNALS